jgi:1,4-dihydroxy-2-naphthoate polyprenyltransferase
LLLNLFKVARLQFAVIGLFLFLFGALWAVLLGAPFSLPRLLLGYLIMLAAQLSVHFGNDYFDVDSDRPGGATLVSGGAGVLQEHPELREPAHRIAIALLLLSLALGIVFIWIYSLPPWAMGFILLGNLIGWTYSAPPLRLSARGFGEITSAITIGFLIPTMGYLVMHGTLDLDGLYFIIPLTFYGLVLILTVAIPDLEDDRLANKMTWVARWGRGLAFRAIGVLLMAASAYFFLLPRLSERPIPLDLNVLGILSLIPLSIGLLGMLKSPSEREPSIPIAAGIIIALAVFAVAADGYVIYQLTR